MRIREFRGTDFEALAKVLGATWHDDHGTQSYWQGADELCYYLSLADAGFTAEADDGTFLGATLAQSGRAQDRNLELRNHWRSQRTQIARMAQILGVDSRADAAWLTDEDALVRKAGAQFGTEDVGELLLLIVAEEARGQGTGKSLMRAGVSWLVEHGAEYVRLVTDDGCDWQLYEHLHMERLLEEPSSVSSEAHMYIYQAPSAELLKRLGDSAE